MMKSSPYFYYFKKWLDSDIMNMQYIIVMTHLKLQMWLYHPVKSSHISLSLLLGNRLLTQTCCDAVHLITVADGSRVCESWWQDLILYPVWPQCDQQWQHGTWYDYISWYLTVTALFIKIIVLMSCPGQWLRSVHHIHTQRCTAVLFLQLNFAQFAHIQ